MTGRCYYITTLADWRRHATRFANSHWLALESKVDEVVHERERSATENFRNSVPLVSDGSPGQIDAATEGVTSDINATSITPEELSDAARILVLVDADEGVHLALEDDAAFEALPHPLVQKSISAAAQSVLAARGVGTGATTFDVTEMIARAHPLLRHRVF